MWKGELGRVGDLGGTGGTAPKKFEVGDDPCIGPPPIFREVLSVVGCARKYEQSKKHGLIKEFLSEIVVFLVKKGSYTTFNAVKRGRLLKKRSSEIFGVKVEIFSGKNLI